MIRGTRSIISTPYNSYYLETKAKKLGHLLLPTYLVTVALQTQADLSTLPAKYEQLEQVRELARQAGLAAQEEVRPVAVALFGQGKLIINLGLEQAQAVTSTWYDQPDNAYWPALAKVLDGLVQWPNLQTLELLISDGQDPFAHLQVGLRRQTFSIGTSEPTVYPSDLKENLQTQRIYTFSRHSPND
ncbi:MAG: bifunctional 3,4-dihydroxy-2-butanone-4-phosphate synthase/GTP cyclohydrolase II, partial [Cyanobacteria bacterium J06607_6]